MREIKFRQPIRDKSGNFVEWWYWGIIDNSFISPVTHQNGNDTKHESQQLTGLPDNNGNDTYEGDILQRVGTRDIFQGSANDIFGGNPLKITTEAVEIKVKTDEFGTTSFGYSLCRQYTYSERTNPAIYTVIGNIYELPELLSK